MKKNMNMKKSLTGLLGIGALLMAGASSAATVQLTPNAPSVTVGDTFLLTVNGTGFDRDVSGGSVELSWDPSLLSLDSTLAELAASASSNGFGIDFGSSATADKLDTVYATFGTVFGPSFNFFDVEFTALAAAMPAIIEIKQGSGGKWQDGALDAQPYEDVSYIDAEVNINAVPVPAAVWLFGSGLIGLVGVARRRKMAL